MAVVALPSLPDPTSRQLPVCSSRTPDDTTQPSEAVYTALIQTYLNLLCYENATFLAERCAGSFPRSDNAIYLLAYCYYRGGSPKSARIVLLTRWMGRNAVVGSDGYGAAAGKNDDDPLERTRSSARYLLARCCYDMGLYPEAEESLLRHCRELFARALAEGGGTVNGVRVRGNRNEAMDAWITQSAVRTASPCPIPNGSAGLNLLGDICRRTNRPQRAIEYYRLSLRLDPLMWTSYGALCELGGSAGRLDEADDPDSVFGVPAPVLYPRRGDAVAMIGEGHHMFLRAVDEGNKSNLRGDVTQDMTVSHRRQQHPLHILRLNRYETPSTPYSGFDNMKIGSFTSDLQSFTADSKGAVNFNLPATASTAAIRGRSMGDSGLPQTKLFATTPAIRETPVKTTSAKTAATPGNEDYPSPPRLATRHANQVLDCARRVVAGLTYKPSPESIQYPDMVRRTKQRPSSAAEMTFSSTPMASLSGATPPRFHAGVSTVKGEKRALFSTNDCRDEGTLSRKKSPKKEELAGKDQMEGTLKSKNVDPVAETAMSGGRDGNDDEVVELDEAMASHHVAKVLNLFCGLGAAYKYLCQYRSRDALELFRELPPEQINTGWVQHQIGKAYFEMSDYQNAQRALQIMRRVEPHRIKGVDILSTTLWQLKKEVELSDLAQQVVDFDRMAPEAWFVVGNCFSLQKEHETAITFFRRAIQLNPLYTYAHTLCGHEYTSNEDFEKAISCYRDAIRVDCRHYNAWYGLGAIYFRQEKFDLAEYHFQRALDINSQSSVLHCHLGMAQHQNGRTMEALDTLSGAFRLDPRNPQAHYQRATIFMTLDRPEDALVELEKVRSAAPKEASVHFNMGKVHKRLGQPSKAMRCFLTALDLDPKDNNLIKAAMDRLDEPDVDEEVSVF